MSWVYHDMCPCLMLAVFHFKCPVPMPMSYAGYHVSKRFLAQTTTTQTDEDPKAKAEARKLFENRISKWTYPQKIKGHHYEHHIGIDNIYYIYHNPVAGKDKSST